MNHQIPKEMTDPYKICPTFSILVEGLVREASVAVIKGDAHLLSFPKYTIMLYIGIHLLKSHSFQFLYPTILVSSVYTV